MNEHVAKHRAAGAHGVLIEPRTVRFERLLPGPLDRVWAYITDSDKRGRWLATGDMDLRVGGSVNLFFRHADLSPEVEPTPTRFKPYEAGAGFSGRITRCEPPRLLAHSWAEDGEDDSEVTYELAPEGDKVRLVLTHRRLSSADSLLSVSGGWHTHLAILEDVLAGRQPAPFWSAFERNEADYKARMSGR